MNHESTLSMLLVAGLVLGSSLAQAAEALPSDEELLNQCKQFAVEDQVTPKEMDAYVTQCVLDLKEQYLPMGSDNLNPPKEAPKDKTVPPR
ncbi:MAG: hypothetical protein HQL96_13655 [Magnetococcales bacterium]|nr:hypothetical protein [Magnetococcales bacterium]